MDRGIIEIHWGIGKFAGVGANVKGRLLVKGDAVTSGPAALRKNGVHVDGTSVWADDELPGPQGSRGPRGDQGANRAITMTAGLHEVMIMAKTEKPSNPENGLVIYDGEKLWLYAEDRWKEIA